MDDPLLALATLSAMRVHKTHGHQDWVKDSEPAR
jgi:hypothetical protein